MPQARVSGGNRTHDPHANSTRLPRQANILSHIFVLMTDLEFEHGPTHYLLDYGDFIGFLAFRNFKL